MRAGSKVLAVGVWSTWSAFAQFSLAKEASVAGEVVAVRPAVAVTLVQKKVVRVDDGTERLVDTDTAGPDDVIEYQATYMNRSDKAVVRVVANLPLPEGLSYVPRSAKPAEIARMSTQDRPFDAEPLSRTSVTGETAMVPPYNEYRNIRWTLGVIPVGASVTVTARARVEAMAPEPAPAAPRAEVSDPAAAKP